MPHFALDPVSLYDAGFGPALVSVTAPGGTIAPPPYCGNLTKRDMGKAPGALTLHGWVPYDLRKDAVQTREHAFVIRDQWGGNIGIRGGLPLGLFWIDNDQGDEFSGAMRKVLTAHGVDAPRRFVLSPKHKHDAFLLRLVDFVSAPLECSNREMKFAKGVNVAKFQILGHGKHAVAGGVHPGTLQPYVWEQELLDIDDVPEIEANEWAEIFQEIVSEIEALGWVLQSGQRTAPASGVPASHGAGAFAPSATSATPEEVDALLRWLPNDGSGSKTLNDFLDSVDNYLGIGYAIYGALGATAEAESRWLRWAHQHPQTPHDHPETRWKSIINQTPRSGVLHLVGLANRFAGAQRAEELFGQAPEVDLGPSPEAQTWQKILDDWVYCTGQDTYIQISAQMEIGRSAFNSTLAPYVSDVYLAVKGKALKRQQRGPRMNELFDADPRARRVRSLTYSPGDDIFVPTGDGRDDLNTWRPARLPITPGVTEAQIKPWLDHVEFVLGSAQERDRFLRWCAYVVQRPVCKPNWHWLVMSKEGLGKDTMIRPVRLAVGTGNSADADVFAILRDFNNYVEHKLLVIGETKQVGNSAASAHDLYSVKLKALLAAPPSHIEVNRKFAKEYQIPNRHALILFSNEINPIFLGPGSRRIHVIDQMTTEVQPSKYYEQLYRELDAGMDKLAASFLHQYPLPADIDYEMQMTGPVTPAKVRIAALNYNPQRDFIEQIVEDARDGAIPEFENLLAEAQQIMDYVRNRGGFPSGQVTTNSVSQHLSVISGVSPVVSSPGRVTPAPAKARINGNMVTARLWRLGDKTHDGKDLTTMNQSELVALWKGKILPRATVTPITANVRAKLTTPPSTPEFRLDPDEEV